MVSMLALCIATFSSPALAQEAPVAGQAPVAEDGPAPGEIVVTAQRRSEGLTDVPVSVTAPSAATIAATGVTDTYPPQQITPGLRMERLGGSTQPSISGFRSDERRGGKEGVSEC